jgi:PKD repeat protein
MYLRIFISFIVLFSYAQLNAQYEIRGNITNISNVNSSIDHHPVYFYSEEEIIDTGYTNATGDFSIIVYQFDTIIIKTVGYCDGWQVYVDSIIKEDNDFFEVNFEICHNNSDEACEASFNYEPVDSVTVSFNPGHNLDQLIEYEWNFGDDQSNTYTQNPQYQYLDEGVYSVQLVTTNPIGCIDTIVSEVLVSDDTYIKGNVSIPGNYFSNAYIILIRIEDNMIEEIVRPDENGYYEIWCNPDNYIMKAVPSEGFEFFYPRVISTYLGGATKWTDSEIISDEHEIKEIDIEMLISTFLPVGYNEISIKLISSIDLSILPIGIYLLDENLEPIDYAVTEAFDRYSFSNIPEGVYYVQPDCPGRISTPILIEFETGHIESKDINFKVTNTRISPLGINGIVKNDDRFDLYPVPVKNELNLVADYPVTKVNVTDPSGRVIESLNYNYQKHCMLNTDNWPLGVYFITVFFENQPPGSKSVVK